jgi:AsmA family/AsmA-like C-terminal region
MTIWKSPIFYFGVLLVMLIVAALGAPYIVDWDSYKADLEDYGERLTARVVSIEGPVSVRLFPWPRLDMEDVRIFDSGGGNKAVYSQAEKVSVRVALAGLFNGSIAVEEIELVRPEINLTRAADGTGNWQNRQENGAFPAKLLEQVKLDKISVIDGTIRLRDEAKNLAIEFDAVSGEWSAPALRGPWRAKGSSHYRGVPFGFTFSSSDYVAGNPFKFGLKFVPEDHTIPVIAFDGNLINGLAEGKLQLASVVDEAAKGNSEGKLRPLNLQADVKANFESVALDKIKIQPVDRNDSSTLIEGKAQVDLLRGIAISADMKAPRVNVDALLGAQSLAAWRVGGVAGFLDGVTHAFPENTTVKLNFSASVMTYAQQTLENVALAIDASKDAIRVKRLASDLPGQSRMIFDGVVFPGASGTELGGTVAVEAVDARALANWVFPAAAPVIQAHWTGARGRLKAQSQVTLTARRFGLQELKYELDGFQGDGELSYSLGKQPVLDAKLNASTLDIDSYLKGGVGLFPGERAISWPEIAGSLAAEAGVEKHFQLIANYAVVNGVRAQDIAIDLSSGVAGLDVRRFDIGSVAGASVVGKGQVLNGVNGPLGDVGLQVKAAEPSGLLQFLGIGQSGQLPTWTRQLGATDLGITLTVEEGAGEPALRLVVDGTSGAFRLSGSGDVQNFSQRRFANLKFDTSIDTMDGSKLLALFGVPIVQEQTGAGRIVISGSGSLGGGVKLDASATAVASRVDFDGEMLLQADDGFRVAGNSTFSTQKPESLVRALGMPVVNSVSGSVVLSANINASAAGVDLGNISGDFGGQSVQGTLRVGAGRRVSANIDLERASLPDVVAMIMMGWRNRPPSFDDPFASELPFGMTGEVWLRPKTLTMWGGEEAREAVIGVLSEIGSRRMSLAGRSSKNETLTVEIGIKPVSGQFEVDLSGVVPMSVVEIFSDKEGGAQMTGDASIEGQIKGTGLTPYAVLADLSGKGRLQATDMRFSKIAPHQFIAALSKVVTAEDLSRAISLLESGGGLDLGNFSSEITVTSGAASIAPIERVFGLSKVEIRTATDLAAGTVSVSNQITFDAQSGLPQASVVLGGPIGAVTVRSLTSDVASKLGYEILARDLAELERVQKQQAEIIAKEEKQRIDDEAKFQAYQEQKAELRLRLRETKVHTVQRTKDAAVAKAAIDALLATEPKATQSELAQRKRELKILKIAATPPGVPVVQPNGLQLPNSFNLDGIAPLSR